MTSPFLHWDNQQLNDLKLQADGILNRKKNLTKSTDSHNRYSSVMV